LQLLDRCELIAHASAHQVSKPARDNMMDLRQGDGSADLPVGRRQSGTAELTKPGLIEGTKKHCGRINRCRRYSFLIADSGQRL
jgi:hypothetical protein